MASARVTAPQSWNRYSYANNNPLRFTDPTGLDPGDYYDEEGNRLGTDGKNDGKFYLVTNDKTANQIKNTTKQRGTTDASSLGTSDYFQLPDQVVRDAVGAEVQRSNGSDSDDKKGGFHEEGFRAGQDAAGQLVVVPSAPGPVSNPQTDKDAHIDTSIPANPADAGKIVTLQVTSHVHPKGEIVVGPGPGVVFGGTTTTFRFNQPPSGVDLSNAQSGTLNMVVGARDKAVYFYNTTGQMGKFPLDKFLKLGKK